MKWKTVTWLIFVSVFKGIPNKCSQTVIKDFLFIILFGFLLYALSLNHPFIWDDPALIGDPSRVSNPSITHIFTAPIAEGSDYFRPVQMLTYRLEYGFWQDRPFGYHIVNIALHISTALLIYGFLWLLTSSQTLSRIASWIFLLHPVHAQTVNYLSSRADLLLGFFFMLTLLLSLRYLRSGRWLDLALAAGSFLLALGSKEYALIIPFFVLAMLMMARRTRWREGMASFHNWPRLVITFILITGFYLYWRYFCVGLAHEQPHFWTEGLRMHTQRVLYALGQYTRLWFAPFDLRMGYRSFHGGWGPYVVLGGGLFVFVLYHGWRLWRRPDSWVSMMVMAVIILLLPVSNIWPLNADLAEHWLYVPTAVFAVLIAYCYCRVRTLLNDPGWMKPVFVGMAVFWFGVVQYQNVLWSDPVKFYQHVLSYEPDFAEARFNLARELFLKKDFSSALKQVLWARDSMSRSARLDPHLEGDVNLLLARIYQEFGQDEAALQFMNLAAMKDPQHTLEQYRLAIKADPSDARLLNNAGVIHLSLQEWSQAEEYFRTSVKADPALAMAWSNLGISVFYQQKWSEAVEAFEQATDLSPADASYWNYLGRAYLKLEDFEKSWGAFRRAQENGGKMDIDTELNIALWLETNGKLDQALESYQRILKKDPNHVTAINGLAVVQAKSGHYDEAGRLWNQALAVDPSNVYVLKNLERLKAINGDL